VAFSNSPAVLRKNFTNSENVIFGIEQRKPHLAALLLAS
jgi:hypothetical protein